jgi:hypothetical protein
MRDAKRPLFFFRKSPHWGPILSPFLEMQNGKMRHLCGLFCTSCTISQCYLSYFFFIYDIDFIMCFPYVKSPFLFNLSKIFSIFHFSIRFTTKLAPNIVIVSLCKLLNLSKGLYGGVDKITKIPPPSDPKRLLLERPEDLAFFTIINLLYDQIDWPESTRLILTGRSNRTVRLTVLPDHLAGRTSLRTVWLPDHVYVINHSWVLKRKGVYTYMLFIII